MRALLHFILRGTLGSGLLLAVCSAIPLLTWLAAAGGSLLLLRRGFAASQAALLLMLLPALVWWLAAGDPRILLILLGSFALAQLLRSYSSWQWVLLGGLLTGLAMALCLQWTFSENLAELNTQLQQLLPQLGGLYQQMSEDDRLRLTELMLPLLLGALAMVLQVVSLLCLMLARYWQALLFNPGGFSREFHALHLPKRVAFSLLALMLLIPSIWPMATVLIPLCNLPLLFAGIALVHAKLAGKASGKFWLVGLYLSLLLFMQFAYPLLVVLALADSLFDFRGLKTRKALDKQP